MRVYFLDIILISSSNTHLLGHCHWIHLVGKFPLKWEIWQISFYCTWCHDFLNILSFWWWLFFFHRDLHSNQFISTVLSISLSPSGYFNLFSVSSNSLYGSVPNVSIPVNYNDAQFDYFDNCDDLCCLTMTDCQMECEMLSAAILPSSHEEALPPLGTLPRGIEKLEWMELNMILLGLLKRIIQFVTYLSESPHILRSYMCPNVSTAECPIRSGNSSKLYKKCPHFDVQHCLLSACKHALNFPLLLEQRWGRS